MIKKYMRVNIESFLDKYIQYASISDDLFEKLISMLINGIKYADVPERQIRLVEESYATREARDKRLRDCAALNNKGIQYEKHGEIGKAIDVYERNIADGYPATHSYDRLMILYRKQKEYDKEIAVIEKAIKVFGASCYNDRLKKVQKLKNKANNE